MEREEEGREWRREGEVKGEGEFTGKYEALDAISTGEGRSGWWIGSYRMRGEGDIGGSCVVTVDVEGDAGSSLSSRASPRLLGVGRLGDGGSLDIASRIGS